MKLKDLLRNLFGFRNTRQIPPTTPQPPVGSNIVLGRLRIFLKYPIDCEQWEWFTLMGWRTIDMRTNRRYYTIVPDKELLRLIKAADQERDALHHSLIKRVDTKWHRSMNGH